MNNLQVLKSIGGIPVPLEINENLDFGNYIVGKRTKLDFFIKNPNENVTAYISNFDTEEPNSVFHGPDTIEPRQMAKCTIEIIPTPEIKDVDFDTTELPPDNFHLKGSIIWSNYHSRFENE